jgi:hypothetical protein
MNNAITTFRLLALPLAALAAAASLASGAAAGHALRPYGWPIKPFDKPHPVRGSLGDPRTVFTGGPSRKTLMAGDGSFSFHFGVDISAPNGTPVYAVESGSVTRVSTAKAREFVEVASPDGRVFQYWHISAAVALGTHVETRLTVLGHILRPAGHVHLAELDGGAFVNPLAAGHLTPYADDTTPTVSGVSFHDAATGSTLGSRRLRGRVEIVAAARDLPAVPVPGAWNGLPVTPALIAWSVRTPSGARVVPTRTVYDVRHGLPAAAFWTVYARGTHQNMTTYGTHYSWKQPGSYLFRLAPGGLDTTALRNGRYVLVVSATDIGGNTGEIARPFTVLNA